MLNSDAVNKNVPPVPACEFNTSIHNIGVDLISEIQRDLSAYDITSLVFLLYDIPEIAHERLMLLQHVSQDIDVSRDMELLPDWACYSHTQPSWRYQFLEALATCQLYSIIRKLGFNVDQVKAYYSQDNKDILHYIHPTKKLLYRLCESIDSEILIRLKKSLKTYDIDVTKHGMCELVLLELMAQKFITVPSARVEANYESDVQKLVLLIENIPVLKDITDKLKNIQNSSDSNNTVHRNGLRHSTPTPGPSVSRSKNFIEKFDDTNTELSNLLKEKLTLKNIKTDAETPASYNYTIKNSKRVGVCYIINQEHFYRSKKSIENGCEYLETRKGSTVDKERLKKTMKNLNFQVETIDDVPHDMIFDNIKRVIQESFQDDDSVFVLCILSHGIKGHIYAADSVPVKVQAIQDLLDSVEVFNLCNKPKLLLLQACQLTDNPALTLVADGPKHDHFLQRSDCLIFWATAPDYEAFRDEKTGSVFVYVLCKKLRETAHCEDLLSIFTKVIENVVYVCAELKKAQHPIIITSLRKKLYLQSPEL